MLLSWGGNSLDETEVSDEARVEREVVHSVRALHMHGVAHTDVRRANVLWDEGAGRAMVIDFEQAVLAERPRPALAPVVPNKRAWRVERADISEPKSKDDTKLITQDDIWAARMILCHGV